MYGRAFGSVASWDRWQFWDVDTATACFWQAPPTGTQASLEASLEAADEIEIRNLAEHYNPYTSTQVTPPCTDLELLDAWPSRPDSPGCCCASSSSTTRRRLVRSCCLLLAVLFVIGLTIGLVILFPLGGAELLELKNYHRVDRFLRLHPTPKGKQLLIHYKHGASEGDPLHWQPLVRELDSLLSRYNLDKALGNPNLTDCSSARPQTRRPDKHKQCLFDIRHIDRECSSENNYGFDRGRPCVFLQFSSSRDFAPRVVEGSDTVAVDCFGNTVIDQENMGNLVYTPDPGYKLVYFPAGPSPPYMAPLIAVQFVQPTIGLAIGVTCTIYANPDEPTRSNVSGWSAVDYWDRKQVHFNLLIE